MKEESYDVLSNDNIAASYDVVNSMPPTPTTPNNDNGTFTRKKRSKSFSLLKAALNIFHEKPSDNEKPKNKKNDWKRVVGSMRPLTLQEKSPSMSPSVSFDNLQPLDYTSPFDPAASPAPSYMSSSSGGTMSQYASAANLQELDTAGGGSDDHDDEVFDATGGDVMIDVKAEEFIAQFYQQMKLQERQD